MFYVGTTKHKLIECPCEIKYLTLSRLSGHAKKCQDGFKLMRELGLTGDEPVDDDEIESSESENEMQKLEQAFEKRLNRMTMIREKEVSEMELML